MISWHFFIASGFQPHKLFATLHNFPATNFIVTVYLNTRRFLELTPPSTNSNPTSSLNHMVQKKDNFFFLLSSTSSSYYLVSRMNWWETAPAHNKKRRSPLSNNIIEILYLFTHTNYSRILIQTKIFPIDLLATLVWSKFIFLNMANQNKTWVCFSQYLLSCSVFYLLIHSMNKMIFLIHSHLGKLSIQYIIVITFLYPSLLW